MSYVDDLNQAAAEALAASSSATDSAQIMFDVANGDVNSTITTANGEVKTIAKAIKDIIDSIEAGVEAPQVEPQTLSAGQTTVTLTTMTTEGIAVYVEGSREFDFTVVNSTDFDFSQSFPDGTRIWVVKRDIEGTADSFTVNTSTGSQTLSNALDQRAIYVDTIISLKALNVNSLVDKQAAKITTTGRAGDFTWLDGDQSSTLVLSTVASESVDDTTDTITATGHGLSTGDGVAVSASVNGLNSDNVYWVINVDTNNFKLATSYVNAQAGTAIDLTGTTNFTTYELFDPLEGVYVTLDGDRRGINGAFEKIVDRTELFTSEFSETHNLYTVRSFVKIATSLNKDSIFDVADDIVFSDTFILDDAYKGARIIGRNPDGVDVKIIRNGVVDTWQACFHVETSEVYFDGFWLEPEEGASNRTGISYGGSAGAGNRIGRIRGAHWDEGVVYPKLTPYEFTLEADTIEAYYSGRIYSSDIADTPPGNIRLNRLRGYETGFTDISGGHVEIGSISWDRNNGDGMKKGSQQPGSVIKVGTAHMQNSLGELALNFADTESTLGMDFPLDATVTGDTSGATALVHSRSRRTIDVYQVIGSFQNGEVVSDGSGNSFTLVSSSTISSSQVFQNFGTNFELVDIGTLSAVDHRGDLVWILNEGVTTIGRIFARNLTEVRHAIRFSPDSGSSPGSIYGKSMTIGQIDIDGMECQAVSSYYPVYLTGGNDAKFTCSSAVFKGVTRPSDGPIRFLQSETNFQGCNWILEVVRGTFSRVLFFAGSNASRLVSAVIDSAGNRWAQCDVTATNMAFAHIRYTATGAIQDDSGTAVQTDVVAI